MTRTYAVGLDVGGTNIKAALVDDRGRIACQTKWPTQPERGVEPVLADMATLTGEMIAEGKIPHAAVVGVGIGAPGPLSPSRGAIFKAANLPKFEDVPIRDELARRTALAAVFDNDGNAAAYGEYWVGAGRGAADTILLTLGTGVGAGVILGGKLLHGHFENAAELGHTIVHPGGRPCACGQRGCLEQYASAANVARRVIEEIQAGTECVLGQHTPDVEAITSKAVVDAVRTGDALASRIWDEACHALAVACVNAQHSFNPAVIVLGGGMSAAGDILLDGVRRHLRALRWSLADDLPEVKLAELGNDAGVIGAAGLMFAHSDGRGASGQIR
ncbi:MAG: ROK family protein [bacterium]|nr:ROK family protein [bacterium]